MNTKRHLPNKGSFKKGEIDTRRNTNGQVSKDAVALSALLKQYLVEEASKKPRWGMEGYATNAQALAGIIWEEAISGKFPFVQFLTERIMGKVKAEVELSQAVRGLSMADLKKSMKEYNEASSASITGKDGMTS